MYNKDSVNKMLWCFERNGLRVTQFTFYLSVRDPDKPLNLFASISSASPPSGILSPPSGYKHKPDVSPVFRSSPKQSSACVTRECFPMCFYSCCVIITNRVKTDRETEHRKAKHLFALMDKKMNDACVIIQCHTLTAM